MKVVVAIVTLGGFVAFGQNGGSLKRVPVPRPAMDKYVKDEAALVVLGKALFWDAQVGSDGVTACATCHFHAGADHRLQNQLTGGGAAPNAVLKAEDFPFHKLADINNRNSQVVSDWAAVAGSTGVFPRALVDVQPGAADETGYDLGTKPAVSVNGINARQVTGRNSPTVINAVFNSRNFWDGRAASAFAGLKAWSVVNGQVSSEDVRIETASLASQAVGPPMSSAEMSYEGRTWPLLGRKMLSLKPLAKQKVSPEDSVLGGLAKVAGKGLSDGVSYRTLVAAAFKPEYSDASKSVDSFTVAESNFALIFGLALQAYQATLVANDSRVDRFLDGDTTALTAQEQQGLRTFQGGGGGGCTACHTGPEMTAVSWGNVARVGATQRRGGGGRGGNNNGPFADTGFFRIGVRPVADDLGVGAIDASGISLSLAVQQNATPEAAVQGLFKAPGLRNVEYTGPYFHNGGQATLEQVVDFYSRGGDFAAGGAAGPGIGPRNFNAATKQSVTAFLKALTDDRVRFERAPFDHPELCVPVGAETVGTAGLVPDSSDSRFTFSAKEKWAAAPAVGRLGNAVPLQTFEEMLLGIGLDGTRAHTMAEACSE